MTTFTNYDDGMSDFGCFRFGDILCSSSITLDRIHIVDEFQASRGGFFSACDLLWRNSGSWLMTKYLFEQT